MALRVLLLVSTTTLAWSQQVGTVTTFAGGDGATYSGYADGIGTLATFANPAGVALVPTGTSALVCDTVNNLLRRIDLSTKTVYTVAGQTGSGFSDGVGSNARFRGPKGVAINAGGTIALVVS